MGVPYDANAIDSTVDPGGHASSVDIHSSASTHTSTASRAAERVGVVERDGARLTVGAAVPVTLAVAQIQKILPDKMWYKICNEKCQGNFKITLFLTKKDQRALLTKRLW